MDGEINVYFQKDPDAFYINNNGELRGKSVHGDCFRFNKAQEESKKKPVPVEEIIQHVNFFLSQIGISQVEEPKKRPDEIDYSKIKNDYKLKDKKDIIWMKFTADGYLVVVAQSNDINFDIPPSSDAYDEKIYNKIKKRDDWKYTSSGILVHKLGKVWDETFVLLFPLQKGIRDYDRHEVETGIGNYLIAKGVPILDYYSHNY